MIARPLRVLVLVAATTTPALARDGFPDYLPLPDRIGPAEDQAMVEETVGQADLITAADGTTATVGGHHYTRWLAYHPAAGEPAPGYDNGTEKRIFEAVTAPLSAKGWTVVYADPSFSPVSAHFSAGGKEAWLQVRQDAPSGLVQYELVELGGAGAALAFPSPSATPENVALTDDLPYLPPWPGSTRQSAGRSNGPLDISPPGSGDVVDVVGENADVRSYSAPPALSPREFVGSTRAALLAAGWTMIFPKPEEDVGGYSSLVAHFTADGRDIWALLSYQTGLPITYETVDLGAERLAAAIKRDCHVPIDGVFFDFNKTDLRPDSDAALRRVADFLAAHPKLKAEIDGHTDNVGSTAYNQALSEGRAAAVVVWLTGHGIGAGRLTSKGFGKTVPIADNATDIGRARNRRVELAVKGCKPS